MLTTLPKIIVIVGPTASGKSDLALKLANQTDAEIISADSIQIYSELNIGSAKPSEQDLLSVKHHLINQFSLDEAYNCAIFCNMARERISNILGRGKNVIVCGGAMLYIKSLISGLADIPAIDSEINEQVELLWQEHGGDYCLNLLNEIYKPEYFPFSDQQRIKRALAVKLQHGENISHYQNQHKFAQTNYDSLFIGLRMDRTKLYDRINQRTVNMLNAGLIEETQKLLSTYDSNIKPLQSIGYKQTIAYLQGKLDKENLLAEIQKKSRNYAKRQITWYNSQKNINWFENWDDNILYLCQNFYYKADENISLS